MARAAHGVEDAAEPLLGAVDEQQGFAQVTEGLQAGDKIVVGNVGTLGRGMQVTIAGAERQQVRRP